MNIDKIKEEIKSWLGTSKWHVDECYDNIVIRTGMISVSIDADNILSRGKIECYGKNILKLTDGTYLRYLPEPDSFVITSGT